MTDSTKNFFGALQSHVFVALISALITISYAMGTYRDKVDSMVKENVQIRSNMQSLSDSIVDLRVEVGKLRLEMELNRINHSK